MTPLSAYSPLNSATGRRRAAAVALCAAALAVIAGCSTGSGSSSVPLGTTGPTGTTGTTGTATRLTPRQAIGLAAVETQRVTSMAATFAEQVGTAGTINGTMQLRLKPKLLAHETLRSSINGRSSTVEEIVSVKAVYVKEPSNPTGRPWLEIRLSDLAGGLGKSLQSLLQNAQNGNPATQTQMFAGSRNVHKVGTEVVNGVQTTHYAGTVTPSQALSRLSPTVRKGFAPLMKLISGGIRFDIWIDGQHVARKVVEVESVGGKTVTVTLNVTAVNQPVQITLPPPGQVTVLPASALGGL
jgi:hypothetical protein